MSDIADDKITDMCQSFFRLPEQPSSECLKDEVMASYLEGLVHGERRDFIEKHLSGCSCCRSRFAEDRLARLAPGRTLMSMPSRLRKQILDECGCSKTDWLELIIRSGKAFLAGSTSEAPAVAIAAVGVRAQSNQGVFAVSVGEREVRVAVWEESDKSYAVWLNVSKGAPLGGSVAWQLWTEESIVEHQPCPNGEAVFRNLSAGAYWCAIWCDGREKERFRLNLEREAEHGGDRL